MEQNLSPGNPPITVVHSCWSWLPMTQNWIYNQISNLPASSINAFVACEVAENLDRFPWPTLHVARRPTIGQRAANFVGNFLGAARQRHSCEVARDTRCDLLHSHFGNHAWNDLVTSRSLGIPHVVTFYGFDVNQLPRSSPLWRKRYRELFSEISAALCEGPHMASCLHDLGCAEDKINLMPLGVELEAIRFAPRQWSPGETLRVLIAASFREKKGIPYAVAALGRLAGDIPLQITIAGDSGRDRASQREKKRILDAVRSAGLDKLTRFVGYVDQPTLHSLAHDHHIFLSPSVTASDGDTEGGAPVAIIEMIATGMPIVSTTHCDIPFVVGPGSARFLANERDVDDLERCLRSLLAERDWDSVILPARAHIATQHNAANQGEALARLYRRVLGAKP